MQVRKGKLLVNPKLRSMMRWNYMAFDFLQHNCRLDVSFFSVEEKRGHWGSVSLELRPMLVSGQLLLLTLDILGKLVSFFDFLIFFNSHVGVEHMASSR